MKNIKKYLVFRLNFIKYTYNELISGWPGEAYFNSNIYQMWLKSDTIHNFPCI